MLCKQLPADSVQVIQKMCLLSELDKDSHLFHRQALIREPGIDGKFCHGPHVFPVRSLIEVVLCNAPVKVLLAHFDCGKGVPCRQDDHPAGKAQLLVQFAEIRRCLLIVRAPLRNGKEGLDPAHDGKAPPAALALWYDAVGRDVQAVIHVCQELADFRKHLPDIHCLLLFYRLFGGLSPENTGEVLIDLLLFCLGQCLVDQCQGSLQILPGAFSHLCPQF